MDYEELAALWRNQRNQYQEWERKLLHSPVPLRDRLETELALPHSSWKEHETNIPRRYVEIFDYYGLDKPERKRLRDAAIRPDGVLVFGLGITFDFDVDTYPKQQIYLPLAARFTLNGPEFAFFSNELDAPEQGWSRDAGEFIKRIVGRFKDYLSHDPHTGFGSKARMGFLE